MYSSSSISEGLLSGGLLSHTTDFGSGEALIWGSTLWGSTLGVYCLGVYSLTPPILDLGTHLPVLGGLHSGVYSGGLL